MENLVTKHNSNHKNRFLKLSLKKNRVKSTKIDKNLDRSLDVMVIDESFDRLRTEIPSGVQSTPKIYSPIVLDSCEPSFEDELPDAFTDRHKKPVTIRKTVVVINDSSEMSVDESFINLSTKEPSKNGNVSFNCSREEAKDPKPSRPSIGGWSPAQRIITATPRIEPTPSIPKDVANESKEECTMKKIQLSQKKLLNDLYGDVWKSLPSLFKNTSKFNGCSKKLFSDDDDDSDKENNKTNFKELYLTGSDVKRKDKDILDTDKKSKKKLYTEKIPNTPEPPKLKTTKTAKPRQASTTTKKVKGKSVTELVEILKIDDSKKLPAVPRQLDVQRLSFMASLDDDVPSWRCHVEAIRYRDDFRSNRDELVRRLFADFNKAVYGGSFDADLPIIWDTKLRTTAGTTTNRLIKTSSGARVRTSSIKLSLKVVDSSRRARDTLAHELCHVATWLLDAQLRAGHGPLWLNWAKKTLQAFPELGEITRCHTMDIHFKYSYKCTKCGYSVQRHSKSIDITKKCCGYCRGQFQLIVNKKNKDGVVVSTPARKGEVNDFAKYVKENYGAVKVGRTHAQVMKILGEQFSAKKVKPGCVDSDV